MTRKAIAESLHDTTNWIMRKVDKYGFKAWAVCAALLVIPCTVLFMHESILGGLILGPITAAGVPWVLGGCLLIPTLGLLEITAYCIESPLEALKRFLAFCALMAVASIVLSTLAKSCTLI